MVKLNKIYTRTGDDGETGLVTGERIAKHAPRMNAIGSIDETNAAIGMARVAIHGAPPGEPQSAEIDAMLERIQNDLFDAGADVATPIPAGGDAATLGSALRIVPAQVARLEAEIDRINQALSPLTSFILPGGTPLAAALHVARTICRRAERDLSALRAAEPDTINPDALRFLNRLSDLLFVLTRAANGQGRSDHLWTPGENR